MTRSSVRAALLMLDSDEREVLELSLRRRIPDQTLGQVFGLESGRVASLRTRAIDQLSKELGLHRGEELGEALLALLEASTWEGLDGSRAESNASGSATAEGKPIPDRPPDRGARRPLRLGSVRAALAVTGAASLAAGLATGRAADDEAPATDAPRASVPDDTRPFVPSREDPAPFPSEPVRLGSYRTARIRHPVVLRARPAGRRIARVRDRTEFGSRRVLGVVREQGAWLAVQAPELRNGQVGWVRATDVRLGSVDFSITVDRSRRLLVVRRDGRELRRMKVTVGRRGSPTPTGRFAVTDRLRVSDRGSPYGCCVLALTGHQTKLPPGWPGGDRLAVHASRDPRRALGGALSLGCLRADATQARWLTRKIPLGTPVFIRS